jgi:hypothetical protein
MHKTVKMNVALLLNSWYFKIQSRTTFYVAIFTCKKFLLQDQFRCISFYLHRKARSKQYGLNIRITL